ncbi:MAG TPA: pyridoxal phosphate-dependent aminotransferase [Aestuariivirgaceae bacterium]|nr:pyridoxal phosphate-dependent aminotransferase [Aestuariivirgaceae bacterium]
MSRFDAASCLSRRTAAVEEAAIIRMAERARDLLAKGRSIVSLTLGEPDFDTPAHIKAAATEAMRQGHTHYAPVAGIPALRRAISRKLETENGLQYSESEIVLANGAKQAITDTVFATIDEGDEAILLAPYWVAYEGILRMAGAVPVILRAGIAEGFKISAARIRDAITPRTKLLFINSPNNPSGAIYAQQELKEIAFVLRDHPRLLVISDEIYEYIEFVGKVPSIGALPGMRDRTITVNGFSKSFAMTGWRLGYAAAPAPLAKAIAKVQGTFTAGANSFVQHAAIAALQGGRDDVMRMKQSYLRRRAIAVAGLRRIEGIKVSEPQGTFYAFPDVSSLLGRDGLMTVDALCDWLLDMHGLAVVPGSAFGDDRCIRISFAAGEADLKEGLGRLAQAFGGSAYRC